MDIRCFSDDSPDHSEIIGPKTWYTFTCANIKPKMGRHSSFAAVYCLIECHIKGEYDVAHSVDLLWTATPIRMAWMDIASHASFHKSGIHCDFSLAHNRFLQKTNKKNEHLM